METLIGCIARGRRGVVHLGLLLLEVLLCCPLEIEKIAREMMAPCRHTKGGGERCRDPLPLPMPWTLVDKNALLWTFALMKERWREHKARSTLLRSADVWSGLLLLVLAPNFMYCGHGIIEAAAARSQWGAGTDVEQPAWRVLGLCRQGAPVTVAQVEPGLPLAGLCGSVVATDLADGAMKEALANPGKWELPMASTLVA